MKSSIKNATGLLLATVGLLTGAAPAGAATTRIYPGASCQDSNGRTGTQVFVSTQTIWVGSFQQSPHADVACPMARHNLSNTNGLSDVEVRLHTGSDLGTWLYCDVDSIDTAGNLVKSVRREITVTQRGQAIKLDFGTSLNVSRANGSYAVWCELPRGAGLIQTRFTEY